MTTNRGQTGVNLTTPLARAQRSFNKSATAFAGTVYFSQAGGLTGGVPDTASEVHLMIRSGEQQSLKCAYTTEDGEYSLVTGIYGSIDQRGNAGVALEFRTRQSGQVFRTGFRRMVSEETALWQEFQPYVIVPPNTDVLAQGTADTNNVPTSAGINSISLRRY